MPTFFGRRYVRGKPGRTEKVLGAALLIFVATIVLTFGLTSGLFGQQASRSPLARAAKRALGISDRPLFALDLANTQSPAPPRAARVAEATLPTTLNERERTTPKATTVPNKVDQAGPKAASQAAPAAGRPRFADLGDPQIASPIQIDRYTDNLYEKIDGREPQYRQFGFVELRVGQYQYAPGKMVFDAYIFDMGEPVNAMGIYMTEKSGSVHAMNLGREGYASGASVYFWKSRYYVNILGPADADEQAAKVAERIARGIDATIADTREPFWADKILPAGDREANSLSYRASSGLGFDFLQRMFVANYKTAGKTYQMYVLRADSPAAARGLFDKFAEATAKYDKVLSRSASPGGQTLVSESMGSFGVTFCKGIYFGGVAECEDRALVEQKAAAFRDGLPEK